MKILVINGTEVKGCTHGMKEVFLASMGAGHEVEEIYLPRDCPAFCTGCKACFYKGIAACPHREYTVPIWEKISAAQLLVFTSPSYVFHLTAQMKALLDHYGAKWMAHSPETQMFSKQGVIITNAIGQGMKNPVKEIGDSLDFWGVARRYAVTEGLLSADWALVAEKKKVSIKKQCDRAAKKIQARAENITPRLKIRVLFFAMRIAQKMIHKDELRAGRGETADHRHWKKEGWLDGKKPWKKSK